MAHGAAIVKLDRIHVATRSNPLCDADLLLSTTVK
jgi:hypothetical protein